MTFTPPADSGDAATTLDLTGTGVVQFEVPKAGRWTVALAYADGTTKTAVVAVVNAGLVIILR